MSSWFRILDNAATVHDVVAVARDYFAAWTPQEVARLPRACRPGKIRDESDLEELHRNAVEAYRGTRATGDDLTCLQRLAGFLAHACVRLAQLRRADEPAAAPTEKAPVLPASARDR